MNKNIIIGILAVVSVFFVALSYVRAGEAEQQAIQAKINLDMAEKNAEMARAQEQLAVEMAARERIAVRKAEEIHRKLEECRSK